MKNIDDSKHKIFNGSNVNENITPLRQLKENDCFTFTLYSTTLYGFVKPEKNLKLAIFIDESWVERYSKLKKK